MCRIESVDRFQRRYIIMKSQPSQKPDITVRPEDLTESTLLHSEEKKTAKQFLSRRAAVKGLGLGTFWAAFGAGPSAVLEGLFGRGMTPVAWAQEDAFADWVRSEKPDLTLYASRPVNGEFAPHLLADAITPAERHFVRNNGLVPERALTGDLEGWSLTIEGRVKRSRSWSFEDLAKLPQSTYALTLECGGNGRALFEPNVPGNPWKRGAVGCAEWTGVPLRVLLEEAGLESNAIYTAHYGEDPGLGGTEPFSRGIPIEKALEKHTLVALKMNGEAIPALHGFPVRLVVPGWIASASQKWLNRIEILDHVHDSKKMSGYSYRVPKYQVAPGERPEEADMEIATSWQIKSMITQPQEGVKIKTGEALEISGHAWAGEQTVKQVLISTDFGVSWKRCRLEDPVNKYAWQNWSARLSFERRGYYEIWARAYDDQGNAQPFTQPWNPKGYLGNVIHRAPVFVDPAD